MQATNNFARYPNYRTVFDDVLRRLDEAFRAVEQTVPAPTLSPTETGLSPRYLEKTARQAVIQKMARYISGLRAIVLLLEQGFLQEQVVIERTLDEMGDDIIFLVFPPENDDEIALMSRFLSSFYQEEFDPGVHPLHSTRRRKPIQRKVIDAYIEKRLGGSVPDGARASGVLYRAYSGYVHAASPQLMEMVSRKDLRFQVAGVHDPRLVKSHMADALNYFVRGLMNMAAIASAAGKQPIYDDLKARADTLMAMD